MIDVVKLTPQVYSKRSRGYQLLSRLFSSVFNTSRSYINSSLIWEKDIDNKLTELRANTLNLRTKYDWDLDTLEALTACFKHVQSYKGTKKALIDAFNIVLKAEKTGTVITEDNISIDQYNCITITLKKKLKSFDIIDDIMQLFVPSCLSYRIIYDSAEVSENEAYSDVFILDNVDIDSRKLFGNSLDENDFVINNGLTRDLAMQRLVGVDSVMINGVEDKAESSFSESNDGYTDGDYNYYLRSLSGSRNVINDDVKTNERFINNTVVYTKEEFNELVPEGDSNSTLGAYKKAVTVVTGDDNEEGWI